MNIDASLGAQIFGVPLVVPFAWVMMVHPALSAARRIAGRWVFLYGRRTSGGMGSLLRSLRWLQQDAGDGRYRDPMFPFAPDIPSHPTPLGWLLAGLVIVGILHAVLPRDRDVNSQHRSAAVDALLLWTLFSGFRRQPLLLRSSRTCLLRRSNHGRSLNALLLL